MSRIIGTRWIALTVIAVAAPLCASRTRAPKPSATTVEGTFIARGLPVRKMHKSSTKVSGILLTRISINETLADWKALERKFSRRTATGDFARCSSADPEPLPQPPAPSAAANGGCAWKWSCFRDENRYPETWLAAELIPGRQKCSCQNRCGVCKLDYVSSAVLLKDKKTSSGRQLWKIGLERLPVGAHCYLQTSDEKSATL